MPKTPRRPLLSFLMLGTVCAFFLILFTWLGIWQIQRLHWKEQLIAQVNARLNQPPVLAPLSPTWHRINVAELAYLPVKLEGAYLTDKAIYVTSVTNYGSGYWLLMPLKRTDGSIVFINRGFVPMDFKESVDVKESNASGLAEKTIVTGLLRPDEGAGWLMNKNNPVQDRWYKRDIMAMARKLQLDPAKIAPFFVDADKRNDNSYPIGGLTIVNFRNAHLSYAVTWFTLALGALAALVFLIRTEYKNRNL